MTCRDKSFIINAEIFHKKNPRIVIWFHVDFNRICRVLVRRARKLAQQYFLVYQEPIPTGQLVQRVASVMQEYTQSGYAWYISTAHFTTVTIILEVALQQFCSIVKQYFEPKYQWHNMQLFCFDTEEFGHLVCRFWLLAGMKIAHTFSSLTPRYAIHFVVIISFIVFVQSSLNWKKLSVKNVSSLLWTVLAK